MKAFYLTTYESESRSRAGIIVDGRIGDVAVLSGRPELSSTLNILDSWAANEPILEKLANEVTASQALLSLDAVKLLPPIVYPPAVYCAAANYADHVANMERKLGLEPSPDPKTNGGRPFHFYKASRCCVGQNAHVRMPSERLDWEGELVVVIGAKARHVAVSDALKHVAGYMVGNDLSARDIGFRTQTPTTSIFHHSFIDHKGFEHSAPIGPWLTPASQIGDPGRLSIKTSVNGKLRQDGNTSSMIFTIQEQLAYLSTIATLHPGDIIMTGTPAGVGMETGEFLREGDHVSVSIDGLGTLDTFIE